MQSTTTAPRQREKIRLEPVTPELLAEVVRRIVAAIDPDKIILFGSYAHGTPHEYSDLDLFIIKSGQYDRLDMQGKIDSLFWDISLPMDILVRTPEQVNQELALGNAFIRVNVLQRGKVLYERATANTRVSF
jgi:predicted nucleotidyltransferase